jgi:hypothetical protein
MSWLETIDEHAHNLLIAYLRCDVESLTIENPLAVVPPPVSAGGVFALPAPPPSEAPPLPFTPTLKSPSDCKQTTYHPPLPGPHLPPCYPQARRKLWQHPNKTKRSVRTPKSPPVPRSAEGKAASRFNALKSGIDAKAQVIPDEDPDQLEVLVAEYQERFSTAAPERRLLVDTLVNSEWLLRRLNRAEAEFWQYEAHRTESNYSSNEHPNGRVLYHGDRVFDRLQRRIDSVGRNYHRALKELQSLEAAEQPEECPPEQPEPPATGAPAPASSQSNQ